jgi:hypothetical protein
VRLLEKLNTYLRSGWLHRSIEQALALNRTEVRPDGLRAEKTSLRLTISWRARNLHPWDLDLVGDRRARKLVQQTFLDTEAALERLFKLLPEVDVIDLTVLETDARRHGILMSGSIVRREFEAWHPSSTLMRLKLIGLNYNLVNLHLQPLDSSDHTSNLGSSATHPDAPLKNVPGVSAEGKGRTHAWHKDRAGPH